MATDKDYAEMKEDILKRVRKENVKFIEMQFSDILGIVKSVSIPTTRVESVIDDGVYLDGSSILGYATIEESDMRANPILDSFQIYPWVDSGVKTARFMCTISDHSGNRFKGDPRWALEKMVDRVKEMGYEFNVGPEFEFFMFPMQNGVPVLVPADAGGYFDLMPQDKGEVARKEMVLAFDTLGYDMEASHHEVAPGQVEIDLRYQSALTMADRMLTLKYGVKCIAQKYGLYASFMPKPLYGENGSGMHVHMSLSNKDRNAFYDPEGKWGLSEMAMNFMGGLLAHAKENCAILASYVNSYKRLVPGYEAPCYISWANMNRSALLRVPAGRGMRTRVEQRNPDPAGNPYLQFAVMLAAGLDGIKNRLSPGEPIEKDIYHMSPEDRRRHRIEDLPMNLGDALDVLAESKVMKEALGEHIFNHYLHIKGLEWDEYRKHVTDWEIQRYLRVL
ncbi:MAG TPA: glutamine synthetase family protein [Methanomassiliicoccales archaeon]|nr:glutamine synthetase family protein [Methanomassiliicoccales archaeon]